MVIIFINRWCGEITATQKSAHKMDYYYKYSSILPRVVLRIGLENSGSTLTYARKRSGHH